MTNFKWAIPQTDYNIATGFIFCAHWTCTATDGAYTAPAYSTCSFAAATPSIPYASVTEQDVLNWIWANGVGKDTVEASLQGQIDLQKNPVQATGTPWTTGA
jgi:hypothetical protein